MKCVKCHVTMEPTPDTSGVFVCPADPLHVVKTWEPGYQPFTPVRDAGTLAGAAAEAGWRQC